MRFSTVCALTILAISGTHGAVLGTRSTSIAAGDEINKKLVARSETLDVYPTIETRDKKGKGNRNGNNKKNKNKKNNKNKNNNQNQNKNNQNNNNK